MRLISLLSLIALLNFSCNNAGNDEVLLKFDLKEGATYRYNMNVKMQQEMAGQTVGSDMQFTYDVEVVDDSSGVKTLRSVYERIRMEMNMPGAKNQFSMDTDKPNDDSAAGISNPMGMMKNMFYAIKGKSFSMKVSPEGEVLSISGLDEMRTAMIESMDVEDGIRQGFEAAFSAQFNETNLKQAFSQAFNMFPNKAVKLGDTWQKDVSMGGMMAGNIATNYKVKEIRKDEVVLDSNSELKLGETSGTQTGTIIIDPSTGLVKEGTLEQKFEGQLKMTSTTRIDGRKL